MALQSIPLYKMVPVPGCGLGMIATSPIKTGSLIISEPPLFTIEDGSLESARMTSIAAKLRALSKDQQRVFFSLHNAYGNQISPLLGIVKTNAHALGVRSTGFGVFPECSRFNHSCTPNAIYSWQSARSREEIYAVKDIVEGEQITVNYLGERINQTRNDRRSTLLRSWQFNCQCDVCGKSEREVKFSDARRKGLAMMDEEVGAGVLIMFDPARALDYCRRILQLYQEEGLIGASFYRTYYDAFQICVTHGDLARASAFAALAVEMQELCEGKGATGVERIEPFVEHPESHRLAGMSS